MGVQINLGSFNRFVPKPECDDRGVDSRLQKLHGSTVPEHVRRDTFLLQ